MLILTNLFLGRTTSSASLTADQIWLNRAWGREFSTSRQEGTMSFG